MSWGPGPQLGPPSCERPCCACGALRVWSISGRSVYDRCVVMESTRYFSTSSTVRNYYLYTVIRGDETSVRQASSSLPPRLNGASS